MGWKQCGFVAHLRRGMRWSNSKSFAPRTSWRPATAQSSRASCAAAQSTRWRQLMGWLSKDTPMGMLNDTTRTRRGPGGPGRRGAASSSEGRGAASSSERASSGRTNPVRSTARGGAMCRLSPTVQCCTLPWRFFRYCRRSRRSPSPRCSRTSTDSPSPSSRRLTYASISWRFGRRCSKKSAVRPCDMVVSCGAVPNAKRARRAPRRMISRGQAAPRLLIEPHHRPRPRTALMGCPALVRTRTP